jgi:3-deoxy-D-manno-octulosonic-acid transferase
MRILYSIVLYLGTPFILLHFAFRSIRDPRYRERWNERFGRPPPAIRPGGIVVHAASVGELNAALPLLDSLQKLPGPPHLLVTTFTPTGSARALEIAADNAGSALDHCYAPLDLPGSVQRFLDRSAPRMLIIMETEIWPNLYAAAHRRNIPIVMANARLSEGSFRNYRRFHGLVSNALVCVSHIAAQSAGDAERLLACGAPPAVTHAMGNLKFDLAIDENLVTVAQQLRAQWGSGRPVLIAASTHEADDEVVLDAFGTLLESIPDALLILVPRHPERFGIAVQQAAGKGFRTDRYSENEACRPEAQCFVIDAMGVLMQYYACSDVAFVGGSFGNIGGHNPLEASALGKPVLVGPDTGNFRDICDGLLEAGAALRITDAATLAAAAMELLQDTDARRSMGNSGLRMVEQGRGALFEITSAVEKLLD